MAIKAVSYLNEKDSLAHNTTRNPKQEFQNAAKEARDTPTRNPKQEFFWQLPSF